MGRRSNSSRRRRRGGKNQGKKEEKINSITESVQLTCVKCGKQIRYPQMALSTPDSGDPIHFDCVIEKIAEEENLGAREKICYLGQGSFGIIKFKSGGSSRDFVIKKRIPYENKDTKAQWRKPMRYQF